MFRLLRVLVDIPALNRLLDFLEADEQSDVDAMTVQVRAAKVRLTQSNAALRAKIQENQQNAS